MADNALAPRSKNALARRNATLRQAADFPQYGELIDYLSARRMVPAVDYGYGGSSFTYPVGFYSNLPATGIVRLSSGANANDVLHEMAHAAQRQFESQYYALKAKSETEKLKPDELQFMAGYEKLVRSPGQLFGRKPETTSTKTARSIAPEWVKQKSDYRSTGSELQAFGMGSVASPNALNPAPLHVDPTYGTEFQVLLDLANRAQKLQPFTPGR